MKMTIALIATLMLISLLVGNKIGFEAAKAKYHGAQQDANSYAK